MPFATDPTPKQSGYEFEEPCKVLVQLAGKDDTEAAINPDGTPRTEGFKWRFLLWDEHLQPILDERGFQVEYWQFSSGQGLKEGTKNYEWSAALCGVDTKKGGTLLGKSGREIEQKIQGAYAVAWIGPRPKTTRLGITIMKPYEGPPPAAPSYLVGAASAAAPSSLDQIPF